TGIGRMRAAPITPWMRGYTAAAVQDLDRGRGDPDVDFLPEERVRYAVVVAEHVDMVVDVHARLLPPRVFVADLRQRTERRPVERVEERAPAALHLLKRAIVQDVEQPADFTVQLAEREEGVFAEPRQDPSLDEKDAGLDLRLVARPCLPRGQHHRVV